MCEKRFFPRGIKSLILRKPRRVIAGNWYIEDRVCNVCGNVLTRVHGDNDIGNCNKCHVNWLHNKTHEDWLMYNQLGDYTPRPLL